MSNSSEWRISSGSSSFSVAAEIARDSCTARDRPGRVGPARIGGAPRAAHPRRALATARGERRADATHSLLSIAPSTRDASDDGPSYFSKHFSTTTTAHAPLIGVIANREIRAFVAMLSLNAASLAFTPAAAALQHAPVPVRTAAPVMETASDLKSLAGDLNPIVGFCAIGPARTGAVPAQRL